MTTGSTPVTTWRYTTTDYAAEIEAAVAHHTAKYGAPRRVWVHPQTLLAIAKAPGERIHIEVDLGRYFYNEIPIFPKGGCRPTECMVFA